MSNKIKKELSTSQRRRGRPTGKNRVPLSAEERRARNALYERERRTEYAEAVFQLAEAAGCQANISNSDLLATVISQIRRSNRREPGEDLDFLRKANENLQFQIDCLTKRLEEEPGVYEDCEVPTAQKLKLEPGPDSPSNIVPSSARKNPRISSHDSAQPDRYVDSSEAGQYMHLNWAREIKQDTMNSPFDSNIARFECTNGSSSSSSADFHSVSSSQRSHRDDPVALQLEWNNELALYSDEMHNSEGGKTQSHKPLYKNESVTGEVCYNATYEFSSMPIVAGQYHPPSNLNTELKPETQLEYENIIDGHLSLTADTGLATDSESMLDLFTDTEKGLIAQWLTSEVGSEIYETENYTRETPLEDSLKTEIY